MRLIKYIKRVTLIVLIMAVGVGFAILFLNVNPHKESIDSTMIEERIAQVSELAVLKYNYKNVASYKDVKQFKGIDLPFTKKSFIIAYTGYIKAGTNLETVDIIIREHSSVLIKVDPATILDNVINEEDVEIYDEDSAIFNKLDYSNLFDVLVEEKSKVEKELIENGFLEEANSHIKVLLTALVKNMGFEKVEIIFR